MSSKLFETANQVGAPCVDVRFGRLEKNASRRQLQFKTQCIFDSFPNWDALRTSLQRKQHEDQDVHQIHC